MACIVRSATYNPGMRTTRSPLTASERSTAIGITTGMIGTTGGRGEGKQLILDGQALGHSIYTAHPQD